MTDLDWSRPIEAVHEDGRVVPAFVDWKRSPDMNGDHWLFIAGEPAQFCAGDDDRRISPICHGWRVRNVSEVAPNLDRSTTPELDPALWDRMVALVRMCAEWKNYVVAPGQDNRLAVAANEARAIVADLPKPVDPGEQYAADLIRAQGWQGEGPIGEAAVLSMIAKAHRDGRELATPEVSHVG